MSEVVDSSLKTAVKGTTLLFTGTVAGIFLWFATRVLVIRSITKEELGLYSLALAVVSILSLLATAGLDAGAPRYVSIFLGEGRKEDAFAVERSSVQLGTLSGLGASTLLFILAGTVSRKIFYLPELVTPLRVISFYVFFRVLAYIVVGVIRGHGNIRPRVYYVNIGQPLFFLLLLVVFLGMGGSFISIIYAYLFSMILVWAGTGAYGWSKLSIPPFALRGHGFRRKLLKFSIPLISISVMGMVFNWTDTLMLGRYTGPEEVGVYNVSTSLARLLTFVIGSGGFVFMPIAGELYAKKRYEELKRTYQVLTKWVFSATVPLFFVLFFFPETTITFLFEQRYIDSAYPLRILSIGYLFNVLVGANIMLMMVLGLSKDLMGVSIFGTLLNILLNYVFIKWLGYGIVGASAATTIAYIAIASLNLLVLYRNSRIQPFTGRYIRPILASGAVGFAIYAVAKSMPLHFWMLPIYFVVFVTGYALSILLTRSVDREDIAMFEAVSAKTGLKMAFLRNLVSRFSG